MAKSTVLPFELPSEFSPDPLTEVIQAGARELLRTAVQAEVAAFIGGHAHLLDDEGRQRLVRHGFLPEREVMTGIGTVPVQVPRVRDRGSNEDGSRFRFRSSLVPPYPRTISIIRLPAKCPELNPPSRARKHALPGNGRKYLAAHAGQLALQPRFRTL